MHTKPQSQSAVKVPVHLLLRLDCVRIFIADREDFPSVKQDLVATRRHKSLAEGGCHILRGRLELCTGKQLRA